MNEEQPPSSTSLFSRIIKKLFHKPLSTDSDFISAIQEAEHSHIIDAHSRTLIEGVMQLEHLEARDVMVPKTNMVCIEPDFDTKKIHQLMVSSSHSRFPVFNQAKDKIQGVLLAKDLLSYLSGEQSSEFNYREYLRPAIFVPESQSLGVMMRRFQSKKTHMAIVMDEYGEIAGLVTLEDVLEQIVGEIEDEHDLEEENIIDFGEGRYLLKSGTPIEEFNEFFDVILDIENVDTIAGFVVNGFTYLPDQMSEIDLQGFRFKVLKSDSRRLHLLEVRKILETSEG
ncbi:MAG: CBS domain-containing protein [Gammaproteobacteria bacterium]|jgi:magnesium and cobalt transporter